MNLVFKRNLWLFSDTAPRSSSPLPLQAFHDVTDMEHQKVFIYLTSIYLLKATQKPKEMQVHLSGNKFLLLSLMLTSSDNAHHFSLTTSKNIKIDVIIWLLDIL